MKITQKKFTNQTHFEFGETSLSFAFGDKGGRQEFTVDYAAIEQSSRDFEDRKTWYRNFGVLWVVLGAVLTGYVYWQSAQINPSLFLFLGIACLVAYQFSLTQYSVFDTEQGELFVIKDAAHDQIIEEIQRRREACLIATG